MFESLAQKLTSRLSRRTVLRGMAGGGGALVAAQAVTTPAKSPDKVELCHKPGTPDQKTLTLPDRAVAAHLGHGDHLGPCVTCDQEGAMECEGTGFLTCNNGVWFYRDCGESTVCMPGGNSDIVCHSPES